MNSKGQLSTPQRYALSNLLRLRYSVLEQLREQQLPAQQEPDDAGQDAAANETTLAVLDIERDEFEAVRSALERIHGVGYGRCEACQMPIGYERLKAEPQALRCLACQALVEQAAVAA